MSEISRKEFLKKSAVLAAAAIVGSSYDTKRYKPLLSFSTLGCPDWSFSQITDFAAKHGYKGIEIRGLQREMDLPKCEVFSKQNQKATLIQMKEKGLQFVGLGSSAKLQFAPGAEREKNLDEAKRFIDLAHQINCPYIRVFPDKFPTEQGKEATINLIIQGMVSLSDYAKGTNVNVLIETHGDLVQADDMVRVMKSAERDNVGVIWDISNMWTITKEPLIEVYAKLKSYIRHAHIKDAKLSGDKLQYTLLGRGDVPVFDAISLLAKNSYRGFYSFEWEKLWHPEIEVPEIALADYTVAMKKYFREIRLR